MKNKKRYMVEMEFMYGWDDAGWQVTKNGKEVTETFPTIKAAKEEIREHVRDCKEAGMEGYSLAMYRVVPFPRKEPKRTFITAEGHLIKE